MKAKITLDLSTRDLNDMVTELFKNLSITPFVIGASDVTISTPSSLLKLIWLLRNYIKKIMLHLSLKLSRETKEALFSRKMPIPTRALQPVRKMIR